MTYNEERLRRWSAAAGEEMREDFNNPDIAAIEVARLEPVAGTDPPEVCVYWQARMTDGSIHPTEAYFEVETPDLDDDDFEDAFGMLATSKIFAYLAPELKRAT